VTSQALEPMASMAQSYRDITLVSEVKASVILPCPSVNWQQIAVNKFCSGTVNPRMRWTCSVRGYVNVELTHRLS
jgi:hypothetical protein